MNTTDKRLLDEGEQFTQDLKDENKERFLVTNKANALRISQPGTMMQMGYNPKHWATLPFFDKLPCIIILRKSSSYILGLNLHFVPFPMRKLIAEYIIRKNVSNIKANKPIYINYSMMKEFLVAIKATICIRLYIVSRIKNRITMVNNHKDYVIGATALKTSMITGMTQSEIYKLALGAKFDPKKKTGTKSQRRTKKKDALKK